MSALPLRLKEGHFFVKKKKQVGLVIRLLKSKMSQIDCNNWDSIDIKIQIANDHAVIKIHMHSNDASCKIVNKSRTRYRRGPINTNNANFLPSIVI